ncbi:hypothetical protein, partial [Paenibacillus sp. CECT 9249]|uniref:hypothetical protein n=1 Tax=Paenibacillus sp. CECT 9249 TaxID=2845385 RepID=UPI001E4C5A4F
MRTTSSRQQRNFELFGSFVFGFIGSADGTDQIISQHPVPGQENNRFHGEFDPGSGRTLAA